MRCQGRDWSDVSPSQGDANDGGSPPETTERQRRSPHDQIQREHSPADPLNLNFKNLELRDHTPLSWQATRSVEHCGRRSGTGMHQLHFTFLREQEWTGYFRLVRVQFREAFMDHSLADCRRAACSWGGVHKRQKDVAIRVPQMLSSGVSLASGPDFSRSP